MYVNYLQIAREVAHLLSHVFYITLLTVFFFMPHAQ